MKDECFVITPPCRLAFANLFEPKAFQDQAPKFSVTMLFRPTENLKPLEVALIAAARKKWSDKLPKELAQPSGFVQIGSIRAAIPGNRAWPIKNGNDSIADDGSIYAGFVSMVAVRASSKADRPPELVDQRVQPIMDRSQLYSGCWAYVAIRAYAYDAQVNKGLSFALISVQKIRDDQPFGNAVKAEDCFSSLDDSQEVVPISLPSMFD
jgi:hypothetical protein